MLTKKASCIQRVCLPAYSISTFRIKQRPLRPPACYLVASAPTVAPFRYSPSDFDTMLHRAMSRYTGIVITRNTAKNAPTVTHHGTLVPPIPGTPIPSTMIRDSTIAIRVHTRATTCFAFIVISNILTSSSLRYLTYSYCLT